MSRSLNLSSQVGLTVPMEAELPSLPPFPAKRVDLGLSTQCYVQTSDAAGDDFRPHTTSGLPAGAEPVLSAHIEAWP